MNLLHGPAASPAAIAGFSVLVGAVAGSAVVALAAASRAAGEDGATVSRRRRRAALLVVGWLALTWAAARSGILGDFARTPPPLLLFMAVTAALSTTLAFSKTGALLARHLPLAVLVGFQAFRIPLEIILHQLFLDGVLPPQMTYHGMNYDIASGITAAALALWLAAGSPPRFVVRAWNILGVVLLLVIVVVAVLSAPVPFRVFMNEPANTIVTTTPFVWLPTVLVQAAWIGHLLVFRRLRMDRV